MKLRIRGNSLRLRLTKSEVARLASDGRVEESTSFPNDETLLYCIERRDDDRVTARLDGTKITVAVPGEMVRRFAESEDTGLDATDGALKILVEKDWQCLTARDEDDSDAYPHPAAKNES